MPVSVATANGQSRSMFAYLVTTVILTAGTYLLYKYFFSEDESLKYGAYNSSSMSGGGGSGKKKQEDEEEDEEEKDEGEDEELYPIRIFFGSQSGTAEGFAFDMVSECKMYGFKAEVIDLEEFDAESLADLQNELEDSETLKDNGVLCLFLVATYGEGDPTDNAQEFYNWLNEAESGMPGTDLSRVNFAVFGLGNSQYEFFNAMGEFFDRKLDEFGGHRLLERGIGDDDVGSIEDQFEQWKSKLWPIIALKFLGKNFDALSTKFESTIKVSIVPPPDDRIPDIDVSKFISFPIDTKTPKVYYSMASDIEYPFSHTDLRRVVLDARKKETTQQRITPSLLLPSRHSHWMEHVTLAKLHDKYEARPSRSDGSTTHVEFDITGLKSSNGLFFKYKSADNLGIVCRNDNLRVANLCSKIFESEIENDQELEGILNTVIRIRPKKKGTKLKIPVPYVVSIRNLFAWYLDITSVPTKKQLAYLCQFCKSDFERAQLEKIISSEGGLMNDERESYWNILKVLEHFPSIDIDLTVLIEILRPLQPRLYTISSSDKATPAHVSITCKLEYEKGGIYFGDGGEEDYIFGDIESLKMDTFRFAQMEATPMVSPATPERPDSGVKKFQLGHGGLTAVIEDEDPTVGATSADSESIHTSPGASSNESDEYVHVPVLPDGGFPSVKMSHAKSSMFGMTTNSGASTTSSAKSKIGTSMRAIAGLQLQPSVMKECQFITEAPFVGVCSRYVHELKVGDMVQVYVTASSFRLPNHSTPVIMIGAGAGLAPFRAFVSEGNHALQSGKVSSENLAEWWLFFGCRWPDVDYIYQDFLEQSMRDKGGCLSQLKVAFSRAQEKKVYVQDLIRKHGEELYQLLVNRKARVFVCGGPAMGNAVRAAFTDILEEYRAKFQSKEQLEISQMLKTGQYTQELW